MLFVVAVVVVAVLFLLVSIYVCLLARVGVLGYRRGTALGHPCGMPPTGASFVLVNRGSKTERQMFYT